MMRALVLAVALLAPAAANALTVKPVAAPSGAEVWLSEEHAIPMIAVSISLPAGSAYDPPNKPGLASFTASLLDEGAGDLNAEAFKQALEARAIKFGASADRDYMIVSMTTLREHADEAFRLLALALARPRFDKEPVERIRTHFLASLKQDEEDAGTIAAKAWMADYFGNHPYAHPSGGTPASIAAITQGDIKTFASTYIVRGRAKVSIAGDITEAQAKAYMQAVLGPLAARTAPPTPRPSVFGKPGTRTLTRPLPQPAAVFGAAGPLRADPAFIPTFVANYIFAGGGFSSRLMDEVRDKRGLTYGIGMGVSDYRAAGIILGSVKSDGSKLLSAIDVVKSEMARFAQSGATPKELADAKTYLTGSFPLGLDSNVKIASTLNGFQRAGLGPDYVVKRNAMIQAVTLADVAAVAKRYYDPANMRVVIVGTPAQPKPAQAAVPAKPAAAKPAPATIPAP